MSTPKGLYGINIKIQISIKTKKDIYVKKYIYINKTKYHLKKKLLIIYIFSSLVLANFNLIITIIM